MSFPGQPSVEEQLFYERLAVALEPEDLQRLERQATRLEELEKAMSAARWYVAHLDAPVPIRDRIGDALVDLRSALAGP